MRILVEGSKYKISYLKDELLLNKKFYELISNDSTEAKITCVGFHRNTNGEIVYMMPKVFRETEGIDDKNKLEAKIKHNDIQPWARKLTVYFHRGLEIYKKKINSAEKAEENSAKLNSKNGAKEYTYWELVDSFNQFYLRNKNTILFRHIKHISSQAKKTNWSRTVKKSIPIIDASKRPIYIDLHNKKKIVDYEEELIIMFLSILNFFNEEHALDIKIDTIYKIAKGSSFKSLKRNGKAKLRKIKHRYYSDVMKKMFSLCEIYFKTNDTSTLKKGKPDFMAVNKYNTVFEAMLEKLLSEGEDVENKKNLAGISLKQLKQNRDGKIIDHIYKDASLINKGDYIYFIADAKYYSPEIIKDDDSESSRDESDEEKNIRKANSLHGELSGVKDSSHSFYKQFTYAKNTIQLNVELFYKDDKKNIKINKINLERVNYRDEITEGYNITPNFFVYGYNNSKTLSELNEPFISYNNADEIKNVKIIKQWPFRLFDRDTLFLIHYKMSFPYVLKAYASKNHDYLARQKQKITTEFRNLFVEGIRDHSNYSFYKIRFSEKTNLLEFINENFRNLIGKCITDFSLAEMDNLGLPKGGKNAPLIIALHKEDRDFKSFLEDKLIDLPHYEYTFGEVCEGKKFPKDYELPFKILLPSEAKKSKRKIPIYDLSIAAGNFSYPQYISAVEWTELPEEIRTPDIFFICKVTGESMNEIIPNGSWCLFKKNPNIPRNGKIVLVQHQDIQDLDFITGLTVKEIEIIPDEENRNHESIMLKPISKDKNFQTIVIKFDPLKEFRIIGEFVRLLEFKH
jgi:SOS-response transcriptional repressor LexA